MKSIKPNEDEFAGLLCVLLLLLLIPVFIGVCFLCTPESPLLVVATVFGVLLLFLAVGAVLHAYTTFNYLWRVFIGDEDDTKP